MPYGSIMSRQLANVSAETIQVVLEGSQKINQMDKQMEIINQAVTKSFSTVQELNSNMDEVHNGNGNVATQAGGEIVNQINESFGRIQLSFKDINLISPKINYVNGTELCKPIFDRKVLMNF